MTSNEPTPDSPPTIDDVVDPSPAPFETRCRNCGDNHHIQRCPEIWRALRADPDDGPEPWPDFPFRWSGTARKWLLARGAAA